jgi:hypothetical protein
LEQRVEKRVAPRSQQVTRSIYMIFRIEDIEVVIRLQFLMSWLQVEEAIVGVSKEWRSQCFLL